MSFGEGEIRDENKDVNTIIILCGDVLTWNVFGTNSKLLDMAACETYTLELLGEFNMRGKTKENRNLMLLLYFVGIVLILDDLVFHWFGDLSWMDNYNPYTHHWMVGVLLIGLSYWLYGRK